MLFQAYIVVKNNSGYIKVAAASLGLISVALCCYGFEFLAELASVLLVVGFIVLIVSAIAGGGKDFYLYTQDLLSIINDHISIAGNTYSFQDISELEFYYHSFYSQSTYGYYYEHSGMIELGMNNRLSFVCNGQRVNILFSIANINEANRFFSTIHHLQQVGINVSITYRKNGSSSLVV